jgi:NAD(P)-dependent dehydrogenase (short-subunit alcohol dehydrogenase family)
MAVDYGPQNIRVNCVAPTATDTPLIRKAGAGRRALQAIADGHPLRRIAQPEDIANAVLFLASEEARCITGAVLPVDAGWTAV